MHRRTTPRRYGCLLRIPHANGINVAWVHSFAVSAAGARAAGPSRAYPSPASNTGPGSPARPPGQPGSPAATGALSQRAGYIRINATLRRFPACLYGQGQVDLVVEGYAVVA